VAEHHELALDHCLCRRHLIRYDSLHTLLPLDRPVTPLLHLEQPLHNLRVV
jgi:hypothetical protein